MSRASLLDDSEAILRDVPLKKIRQLCAMFVVQPANFDGQFHDANGACFHLPLLTCLLQRHSDLLLQAAPCS